MRRTWLSSGRHRSIRHSHCHTMPQSRASNPTRMLSHADQSPRPMRQPHARLDPDDRYIQRRFPHCGHLQLNIKNNVKIGLITGMATSYCSCSLTSSNSHWHCGQPLNSSFLLLGRTNLFRFWLFTILELTFPILTPTILWMLYMFPPHKWNRLTLARERCSSSICTLSLRITA